MLVDVHVHWHVVVISVVPILMTGAVSVKIMFTIHEVLSCGVLVWPTIAILLGEVEPTIASTACVHGIRRKHVVVETPTVPVAAVIAVHSSTVHATVAAIGFDHTTATTLPIHVRNVVRIHSIRRIIGHVHRVVVLWMGRPTIEVVRGIVHL